VIPISVQVSKLMALKEISVMSLYVHSHTRTRVGILVVEFHDESVARICVFSCLYRFRDSFERRTAVMCMESVSGCFV